MRITSIPAVNMQARGYCSQLWTILGLDTRNQVHIETVKRQALDKLRKLKHLDPDLGPSWGSCQTTAATSMIDFAEVRNGSVPDSLVARYLLQVQDNGESADVSDFIERLETLGVCSSSLSKTQAKKGMKQMQAWLRRDMARKLGVEIDDNAAEPCITHRAEALSKSLAAIIREHRKAALVVYPGTPNLREVRSLIGAEWFIPCAETKKGVWGIDTDARYLRVINLDNQSREDCVQTRVVDEEEFRKGEASGVDTTICDLRFPIIRHIPMVKPPKDGDEFFLVHVGLNGMAEQNHTWGNIISHLELHNLSLMDFVEERFALVLKGDRATQRDFDALTFKEFSLFHFSHLPNYRQEKLKLKVPNDISNRKHRAFYTGWPPIKYQHHGLFVEENTNLRFRRGGDPYEKGTTLYKTENYIRMILRLVKKQDSEDFDLSRSYLAVYEWTDESKRFRQGEYELIYDRALHRKLAVKFISSLKIYHEINFCPETRFSLNRIGLNLSKLESLLENIDEWLLPYEQESY